MIEYILFITTAISVSSLETMVVVINAPVYILSSNITEP